MGADGGLRFDAFLQALSRGLAGGEAPAAHENVERWLGHLVELLNVDCASIVLVPSAGDGEAVVTHSYSNGRTPGTVTATPTRCPAGLADRIRASHPIRVEHASESDRAEVAGAFPNAARAGGRLASYLMLPLAVAGAPLGALALGCVREERAWPDEVVAPLALAADMFAGALARERAREALAEHLAFERLIADLVAALVSVPADQVMEPLERGLDHVVSHFGVDRGGVGRFADDGSLVRVYSVERPEIPPMPPTLEFPWFVEELRRGRSVRIHDTMQAPAHARAEKRYIASTGLRSQLTVPLLNGGRVWGGIGLASFSRPRMWTEEEARQLALVGEIMMQVVMRAEAERAAERQRDELAHVARVAALGELTAALAHELNQPLMAIRVNAQATRRVLRTGKSADVDEVLGDITDDVTRASDLIGRLRDLLRRRELAREVLDVNEVISAVEAIARTEAHRHGADLKVETAAGLPRILGDAIQLQQVVLNLVRNAAEAMSGQPGSRDVLVRTWETGGEHVTISVEDEGPPVDDAGLLKMFTPFSTTKTHGLGIGLAISRSIVEAHVGRLWAERRAGRGLAVRITLPAQGRD